MFFEGIRAKRNERKHKRSSFQRKNKKMLDSYMDKDFFSDEQLFALLYVKTGLFFARFYSSLWYFTFIFLFLSQYSWLFIYFIFFQWFYYYCLFCGEMDYLEEELNEEARIKDQITDIVIDDDDFWEFWSTDEGKGYLSRAYILFSKYYSIIPYFNRNFSRFYKQKNKYIFLFKYEKKYLNVFYFFNKFKFIKKIKNI